MAVTDIKALRILPPLAIARLGSSREPMDNYRAEIQDPVGYRRLVPAETLAVDPTTGEIARSFVPSRVRFRGQDGKIRPVSPFLEVWAQYEEEGLLLPLTLTELNALNLTDADIRWRVQVANIKAFRRTRDPDDKIQADTNLFNDHSTHLLNGSCPNFRTGKTLPFGSAQYIKPTQDFPQVRLRFTPAGGKVYGPTRDKNTVDDVYDAARGRWPGYFDRGDDSTTTVPGAIYANTQDANGNAISLGYLDDECDGVIWVELTIQGKTLQAFGRVSAGPPAFAPDSFPVRTVADELEQAVLGPEVPGPVDQQEVIVIVRRALETVRLLNTEVMNGNQGVGGLPATNSRGRPANSNNMAGQDTGFKRAFTPIFDTALVDALALRARHETVLRALYSGTPAWFTRLLRRYDSVGDLSDEGRRKMPAMMRGADGLHLALTRRQYNTVQTSALPETPSDATDASGDAPAPPERRTL